MRPTLVAIEDLRVPNEYEKKPEGHSLDDLNAIFKKSQDSIEMKDQPEQSLDKLLSHQESEKKPSGDQSKASNKKKNIKWKKLTDLIEIEDDKEDLDAMNEEEKLKHKI